MLLSVSVSFTDNQLSVLPGKIKSQAGAHQKPETSRLRHLTSGTARSVPRKASGSLRSQRGSSRCVGCSSHQCLPIRNKSEIQRGSYSCLPAAAVGHVVRSDPSLQTCTGSKAAAAAGRRRGTTLWQRAAVVAGRLHARGPGRFDPERIASASLVSWS
jgi:hypothetical protein